MLAEGRHLRREDASRAVEGREGLVEHGHVAAYRRVLLDQEDLLAGVGQLEGGLDAGDATANDEHVRVDVDLDGLQGLVERQAVDLRAEDALGLGGRFVGVDGHPRAVLADVGHLHQERVETGVGGRLTERGLVHGGRTGGHHDG